MAIRHNRMIVAYGHTTKSYGVLSYDHTNPPSNSRHGIRFFRIVYDEDVLYGSLKAYAYLKAYATYGHTLCSGIRLLRTILLRASIRFLCSVPSRRTIRFVRMIGKIHLIILPAYLPTCLPAYLPTCLPFAYLTACGAAGCWFDWLPGCMFVCLAACLPV
jgi:hypothetical protein